MGEKNKILLHCCCGPCSTTCVERLLDEGFEVVLWFSNDNIYPDSEYNKRFLELYKVANFYNLEVIKDEYNHEDWLNKVKTFENEKEGGKRCALCFDYNLSLTHEKAKELKIPYFTTTLTVSRYKNSERIFSIGSKYEGFLEKNFKKQDGYAKSIKYSKELGLYRQKYCGCEFSLRDSLKNKQEKEQATKNNL